MSVPYTAIALYPYEPDAANASDDLPLKTKQIVTVTEIVDDDWLYGSYTDESGNSLSGYFPKSFVQPYTESSINSTNSIESAKQNIPEPTSESESINDNNSKINEPIIDSSNNKQNLKSLDPKLKDIESNIIYEPENFKNKLKSFNVNSTPLVPMGKPIEENFIKKSFTAADHRTSYIPPSLGTSKQIKKDEKKPDVISGDIISENSKVEEIEAPRMTLKERMQMLQKQQEEEKKAIEAALKRKEERKKAKQQQQQQQLHHNHTVSEIDHDINPPVPESLTESKTISGELDSDTDDENGNNVVPPLHEIPQAKNIVAALEEDNSEEEEEVKGRGNDANKQGDDENNEAYNNEQEREDDDDDDDDNDDDDDDDDETEEDAEELRKRRLAERMAKLSGGMGMMGMMGMMTSPLPTKSTTKAKKSKKKKEESDEFENVPQAVPILPMAAGNAPIMGMPLPTATKELQEENIQPTENEKPTPLSSEHLLNSPVKPTSNEANRSTDDDDEDDDENEEFQDTFEPATASPKKSIPTPSMDQHPYRQNFSASTTHAPSVPVPTVPFTNESTTSLSQPPPIPGSIPSPTTVTPVVPTAAPPIPGAVLPTTSAPPIPPITAPPRTTSTNTDYNRSSAYAPPQIPNIPSTMPQTVPPSRPSIPPPVPTAATAGFSVRNTPPIPGTVPSIPPATFTSAVSPPPPPPPHSQPPVHSSASISDSLSRHSSTKVATNLTSATTLPSFAGGAPPVPTNLSRHTTIGHAPPPPPPTESVPSIPENSSEIHLTREFTGSSLDAANSLSKTTSNLTANATSEFWWTKNSLPPQLTKTDTYFEVDSTDIKRRNGHLLKFLIYYVLDAHLTSITMELAYDTSEPERLLFFHEEKEKSKNDRNKLIDEYTKYGPTAYNIGVKSLNKSYNGEYIDFIFSNLPKEVLRPIANKTYGAVVYRNNNGEIKTFDEIRPGDILVLVTCVFEGHSGTKEVGFGKPHVSLVTSFDSEKNRIKVIEQTAGVIQQGRYKLKNMKSGKLRVFRIVGRNYVGW